MNYKSCWLTLNRACNLRCKWCYARNTAYKKDDDMPLSLAFQIIDLCKELKIRHITLIGGEPTIYPHLFEVIDYCHNKKISCGIVTNGLVCKDKNFVQNLKEHGINSIALSLKGEDRTTFQNITGTDGFTDTIEAIKNCLENKVNVSVSMVLTEENIDTYLNGIKTMKEIGVKSFHLSFCYEFDTSLDHNKYLSCHNPKKLIDAFVKGYKELDEVTEHNFSLQEGYPLCLWESNIVKEMNQKGQISTICQLLGKSGLIFDSQGNLIPCNAMSEIKLGKLNVDFSTAKELLNYTETEAFKKVYSKLCGLPDKECLNCRELAYCGGGCVCQWTNYDFNQLMEMKNG